MKWSFPTSSPRYTFQAAPSFNVADLQPKYISQLWKTGKHLSKILSVISKKVGVIQESNIYIAQLYQLKTARLRRMKIMASIIVISRLYNGCVVIKVIILAYKLHS